MRGRPPVTPQVGAVLADRRGLAFRPALTTRAGPALHGCWGARTGRCNNAWKQVTALKWAKRVRVGGRNSLARRLETGRANDRGEFNLVQLHRSTGPRDHPGGSSWRRRWNCSVNSCSVPRPCWRREQNLLDELRARTDTWTDHQELARRAQLRAAVTHAQQQHCAGRSPPP